MTTREGPIERAARIAREDLARVLAETARAQRAAGLSDETLGRACRMSRFQVARTLTGTRPATVVELAMIGAAVGLDVRARAFPAGDPLRDAGQQRLLERLRGRLHPTLTMPTEVPLPIQSDLRAWDAVIRGADWSRPVEAETVLDDIQALERRLALKLRDGGVDGAILVVAETRRNRRAIAAAPGAFSGFDRDVRRVLSALAAGRDPGRSSLILL